VAGGCVKAFLFRRPAQPDDTYALLWVKEGETRLTLAVSPERLTVMSPFGVVQPCEPGTDSVTVAIDGRQYLRLAGIGTDQAIHILTTAIGSQVL